MLNPGGAISVCDLLQTRRAGVDAWPKGERSGGALREQFEDTTIRHGGAGAFHESAISS
jgi:hypothetical protein